MGALDFVVIDSSPLRRENRGSGTRESKSGTEHVAIVVSKSFKVVIVDF